ncbi:MAG: MBL fold metallo-hydrolase [Actinomycetota bacterium]
MRPPVRSVRLGDHEIASLPDALGSFGTFEELYPSVPAAAWENYRARFPSLFDGDRWVVPFASFLLRGPGATVLVDTGLGPDGAREPDFMPDRQGWLLDSLADAGAGVDDIDVVFLTHHHTDHIGWNTVDGRPRFSRARYVTGTTAWEWTLANRTEGYIRDLLVPLSDVLELVEGGVEIAPGVTTIATPGHYPGHLSLDVEWNGARAFLLGDVAVNPAQLSDPELTYSFDRDPGEAVETRTRVLSGLAGRDTLVVCGHYPDGGIGRLVDDDGPALWTPSGN